MNVVVVAGVDDHGSSTAQQVPGRQDLGELEPEEGVWLHVLRGFEERLSRER